MHSTISPQAFHRVAAKSGNSRKSKNCVLNQGKSGQKGFVFKSGFYYGAVTSSYSVAHPVEYDSHQVVALLCIVLFCAVLIEQGFVFYEARNLSGRK